MSFVSGRRTHSDVGTVVPTSCKSSIPPQAVERKHEVPPEDLREWDNEFSRLSEAGAYFFSGNRYIFRVSKPDV